ncbi:hypothetical protein G4B88_022367 [Cannabis sativa]|uniref:Uncharacterized protein n=1 Tax=Cannabis sativa TaxID=3483 RepID=A0A7J6HVE0_CANSA|nr:hypothetical protein G4B88_022367 [Cannabis sativa]
MNISYPHAMELHMLGALYWSNLIRVKPPNPKLITQHHDQLRHDSDLIVAVGKPRVHFTRQGPNQSGTQHAPPMENVVQLPVVRTPRELQGCDRPSPNQRRLFPDELRDCDPGNSVPQPSLAPDLAHRLHRHGRRLALLLLSPRRAVGGLGTHHRRPHRAGCARRADDRKLAIYQRHDEHPGFGPRRRRRGCGPRGV